VNDTFAWLLGLDRLRFGEPNVEFGFAHPPPAWGWSLVILAAIGAAWWSYRRLLGPVWWRSLLGVARALVLVLLAVLVAGPRLVKPNETRERDWVIVLVDRSASMGVKDVPAKDGAGLKTRDEQLRGALEASSPLWRELSRDRVVLWMGFDAQAFELAGVGSPAGAQAGTPGPGTGDGAMPVKLESATGRRTALGRALEQALKRAAARPVAGVVVLSDGRSADDVGRAVTRRLEAEKIPVFVVPIGSDKPLADVAVRAAEAPASAFVNDIVPVQVEIERIGPAQGRRPVRVELVDKLTGEVLDQRRVEPPAPEAGAGATPAPGSEDEETVKQAVTLTAKPVRAGATTWTVRVAPEGDDLTQENNQADVEVALEDRPLRSLYFDGSPRWEFRYLKNLLIREKSIVSSNLVLSPGRSYVQEGDEALAAMPTTPAQWREFDVVILGDVSPEVFTPEQLLQIRDLVATRGAGLVWIGGEGSTPGAWGGTPLADLIPFGPGGAESGGGSISGSSLVPAWDGEVVVRPTEAAARYGVLRLRATPDEAAAEGSALSWWPSALADPSANWSRLRWAQRIERGTLKPSAEVLAEARVVNGGDADRGGPLVITMRYGAGRILYVATDEIWRWRYGRGEDLPEKFWLPLVRLLGRDSLARSGAAARLSVTPARAPVEAPVRIIVDLIDQRLIDQAPPTVTVRVTPAEGADDSSATGSAGDVVLTPEDGGGGGIGAGSRRYAGLWAPTRAGKFKVTATDALLSDQKLSADIEVWLQDDELRRPQADHPRLAQLAAATEGTVVDPADLGSLGPLIPNRRVVLVGAPEEDTLWDSPLALMLFLGLMTAEWVGRRLIRYV
jgi:hypothetical protein